MGVGIASTQCATFVELIMQMKVITNSMTVQKGAKQTKWLYVATIFTCTTIVIMIALNHWLRCEEERC